MRRANIAERRRRRAGWRLMLRTGWNRRGWLFVGIVAAVVWSAARLAIPMLTAGAVDKGIIPGDGDATFRYVTLIVLVGVVQLVGTGLRRYCAFFLAYRTETDLRSRLFAHFQRLHYAFHDESHAGDLMALANTDLLQINQSMVAGPFTLAALLTLAGVAVIMLFQSWQLTLLALGALPLLAVAATRFSSRVGPVMLELQHRLGKLTSVVEETVAGIRVVKGFGSEATAIGRLDGANDKVLDEALNAARLRSAFLPVVDFIPTLAFVAVLWYGGRLVIDGQIAVGDLIAYNLYIAMLIQPMRIVGQNVAQAARSVASAARIDDVLQSEPAIYDPSHPQTLPEHGRGEVCFEGVQFRYGHGPIVLDGLDLVLRGGESVAIVGATGSGKTTTARLISRLYDVEAGQVSIDGVDVRNVRLNDLRRTVGIVFEDTFLFTGTVRENIAFADPGAPMTAIRRAARLAGAEDFVDELPDGFDTEIGEHGFSLSGGQRQRIAIARAVLADPRVLILDDATSSVDPTKEHEIRSALGEVMDGRTTLIIAHRPATIALADRVVLLDAGRIVADGTHAGLLASSERYREVLAQAAALAAHDAAALTPNAEESE